MRRKHQFPLAALFIASTVVGLLCALSNIIGYAVVFGVVLVEGVFLVVCMAVENAETKDNRNKFFH
jgi:hypothetical protein